MLQKPYIIFDSQREIIIPNKQGFCFSSQTTTFRSSPSFMQFVQLHNEQVNE